MENTDSYRDESCRSDTGTSDLVQYFVLGCSPTIVTGFFPCFPGELAMNAGLNVVMTLPALVVISPDAASRTGGLFARPRRSASWKRDHF